MPLVLKPLHRPVARPGRTRSQGRMIARVGRSGKADRDHRPRSGSPMARKLPFIGWGWRAFAATGTAARSPPRRTRAVNPSRERKRPDPALPARRDFDFSAFLRLSFFWHFRLALTGRFPLQWALVLFDRRN